MTMLKKSLLWSCLLVGTATLMAAEETYNQTFDLNYGGNLEVKIDLGSIEIKIWDRETIEFKAVVKGRSSFVDSFDFTFNESTNFVQILGEYPHRKWRNFSGSKKVKVTMSIPRRCSVKLKTAGGNISIQDLEGDAELRTSGGNLTFQNLDGGIGRQDLRRQYPRGFGCGKYNRQYQWWSHLHGSHLGRFRCADFRWQHHPGKCRR